MVNENSLKNLKQGEQLTKWQNTPTKAIRIPVIFEDKILDFAHKLDDGLIPLENTLNRSVQSQDSKIVDSLKELLLKIKNQEKGYKSVPLTVIKELEKLTN